MAGEHRDAERSDKTWSAVLVVGACCYAMLLVSLRLTGNLNFLPSLLLTGALVPPLTVLAFARGRTAHPVPVVLLLGLAAVSGVVGIVSSGLVESLLARADGRVPALATAVLEEGAKLVVPVVVILTARHRLPRAGLMIGVASGMGFGCLETMGYGLSALLSSGNVADVEHLLLLRAMLSPARHVAWTGLATASLWHLASRRTVGAAATVAAVLAGVVVLHAVWDTAAHPALHVIVAMLSVVALLLVIERQAAEARGDRLDLRRT